MTHTIQAQIAENNVTVQAQIETQIAPVSGVEVVPFETSENGTFEAPHGKSYSPVSVSVPQTNVVPLNVSENGTTEAPAGIAYNPVTVDVPIKTEESLTVEQNGIYAPESGKVYNRVVANVPNSYTAQDEGMVVSGGALVSQTSRTVLENGTVDTTLNNSVTVNVPWLMQGPNPVENLGVIYEEETALKDTGFATWTPSTTQETIQNTIEVATFVADMAQYEYVLKWQFQFSPVYSANAEQKAMETNLSEEIYLCLYRMPYTVENVQSSNFNRNSVTNLPIASYLIYYNSNGVLSFYNGYVYGVYANQINPIFSTNSSDTPTVTVKSLSIIARCNATYFSTASAAAIDQERSKFTMRCTLYRTPIGGTMRQTYESLTDLYNNPI